MLEHSFYIDKHEAGCDEAGRGCLAGPVVAAAVILPPNYMHPKLNDSKKINEKWRNILRKDIEEKALSFGVGIVEAKEIDQINILNASFLAMHRAIDQLKLRPDFLLIDGNRFNPYPGIDHRCMIKGDGRFMNIAAASILAKTYRDALMLKYDQEYPVYDWKHNKAYATQKHREAIAKYGYSPLHRKSFHLKKQLKIDFES